MAAQIAVAIPSVSASAWLEIDFFYSFVHQKTYP
jgi:hypothetical protein